MRRLLVVMALAVALPVAQAEHHNKLFAQGVKAFDDLDYQKAIDLLTRAVAEKLSKEDKVAAYQKLSVCHIAFEDEAAAKNDFENLLRLDRSFHLDNTVAPRMRAVFDQAKAAVDSADPLTPPPNTPPPPKPEEPPPQAKPTPLQVELDPLLPIAGAAISVKAFSPAVEEKAASAQLYYRTAGQTGFSKVVGDGTAGRFSITIPGMSVTTPGLEYYVIALDAGGTPIAVAGDADHPLSTNVGERAKSSKKAAVALGVAGGVVVVAVAVGLLVALMPHEAAAGTPGTIQVITH